MEKIAPNNVIIKGFSETEKVGYGETPNVAKKLLKNVNGLSKRLLPSDQLEIKYIEPALGHQGFNMKILRQDKNGLKEIASEFLTTLWSGSDGDIAYVTANDGLKTAKRLIKGTKPLKLEALTQLAAKLLRR